MKRILLITIVALITSFVNAQVLQNDLTFTVGSGFNGTVHASVFQSDGKLIVAGEFTSYNGITRNRIARLNADGTLDLTFDPLLGFSSIVKAVAIQSDGKIVAAGGFSSFNGTVRYSVARLNTDGTLDLTFNSTGSGLNSYVNSMVIQPNDGKIVLGGYFTSYNGTSRNRIVRLNTDGTLDLSFNPGSGYDNEVMTVKLNASEKVVTAGRYSAYNGSARYGVSVINSDGTLDATFNPNAALGGAIPCYALAIQTDGKILFSTISGGGNVYRFSASGTSDGTFFTGGSFGGAITTLTIQSDGKILAGGDFNKCLRRLNTNGSNDFTVQGVGFGVYPNSIFTTSIQSDGKIIVGGTFTNYDYTANTNNIARLDVCTSVTISTQPLNAIACVTENATFNVVVGGIGLNYQWQEDNIGTGVFSNLSNSGMYSGVNTPSLLITGVTSGMNNYKYRCIINDANCQTTSSNGILTVNATQTISSDPVNKIVCELGSTTFNAGISGSTSGLQWQEDQGAGFVNLTNGGVYSGVNTATLSISNIPLSMNGYKYRIVASACSPVTSNFATLTVNAPPVILSQPTSNIGFCMPSSDPINMSLSVSGAGISYQWQGYTGSSTYTNLSDGTIVPNTFIAGGTYSGATSASMTIASPTPNTANLTDPALYRCIISAGGCSVVSSLVYVNFYNTPIVSSQPLDVTKCSGSAGNVTFGVSLASAQSGISYQWQEDAGAGFTNIVNGGMYSGVTSQTLTLTGASVVPSMNGYKYRCVVGACSPSVISDEATLTVDEMPVLTTQPSNLTVCDGMDANFSLVATGNNLTYQWQEQVACCTFNNLTNTGVYSGVNSDELLISPSSSGMNNYKYRCIVSSGSCSANSNQATLTVRSLPTFTSNPTNKVVCEGGNTTMTVNASNAFGVYQWQVDQFGLGAFTNLTDNAIYSGTNSNVLSITSATAIMNGYIFRCVAGSCLPEVFSTSATLTVNSVPMIITNPLDQDVCIGNNATFSVSSSGGSHTYQWESDFGSGGSSWSNVFDNAIYSGATTNTLLLTLPPVSFNNFRYRCVVSSGTNCSANSVDASLSITELITGLSQNTPVNNDPSVDFSVNVIPASVSTWYWNFGDGTIISGNSNPTYVYTTNGTFNACLIALNDCDSVAHCFNVTITNVVGIQEMTMMNQISVQPNPANDHIVISGVQNQLELKIFNTLGQQVYSSSLNEHSSVVNISAFKNGVYYFELQSRENVYAIRRIKVVKSN